MRDLKMEIPEFLIEMSRQMNEQDGRCTSHPFWQVRCNRYLVTAQGYSEHHWALHSEDGEGVPIYSSRKDADNSGALSDLFDNYKQWCLDWLSDNYDYDHTYDPEEAFCRNFNIEEHHNNDNDWPDGCAVHYLQETEEVISTHMTEADALAFIKRKQHDYPKLYTYVESAYWAPQFRQLQDWIIGLTKVGCDV